MLRPLVGTLAFLMFFGGCKTGEKIPFPVKHGYRFELDMENAGEIKIIGSWNNWQTDAHTMHRWGSYYWLDLDIAPGRYEYFFQSPTRRFLPDNPVEIIDDGFGGNNAVAVIQ